jgi:hypothetical protein
LGCVTLGDDAELEAETMLHSLVPSIGEDLERPHNAKLLHSAGPVWAINGALHINIAKGLAGSILAAALIVVNKTGLDVLPSLLCE